MGEPTRQLRGDIRAQDRYGAVVGEPATETEAALLVPQARLLGDAEIATLIVLVNTAGE